jgi:hypothetical protein
MKTSNLHLKKSATTLFALRFALAIGFLVFTVSIGKSQDDKTYVTKNPNKTSAAVNIKPVSQPPAQLIKPNVIKEKMGEHAPDINDSDYRNKLEQWMQNYPEEFEAYLLKSEKPNAGMKSCTYPEFKESKTNTPQKVAEHAPDLSDPDYDAKKQEWMKNYPDEYNACMMRSSESKTGLNTVITPKAKQSAAIIPQKIAEHAPWTNDPDYDAKKAEWMKNYPEEYNACLEKSTKPNTGQDAVLIIPVQENQVNVNEKEHSMNNTNYDVQNDERMKNYPEEVESKPVTYQYSGTTQVAPKPAIKIAEHAPYLNDPDYAAKKAEWIKNYPQEYEQSLNSSIPQNK